jgi:transposase
MRGEQARVPITGRNAARVLQGSLNLATGHCILMRQPNRKQGNFGTYLRQLRLHYGRRPLWMLLDKDPSHTARENQRLAQELNIQLLWLPKQCSELNPMDQLWKELKKEMAANRQFRNIEEGANQAESWLQSLSRWQVLQKAGLHSQNCWLKGLSENFPKPT